MKFVLGIFAAILTTEIRGQFFQYFYTAPVPQSLGPVLQPPFIQPFLQQPQFPYQQRSPPFVAEPARTPESYQPQVYQTHNPDNYLGYSYHTEYEGGASSTVVFFRGSSSAVNTSAMNRKITVASDNLDPQNVKEEEENIYKSLNGRTERPFPSFPEQFLSFSPYVSAILQNPRHQSGTFHYYQTEGLPANTALLQPVSNFTSEIEENDTAESISDENVVIQNSLNQDDDSDQEEKFLIDERSDTTANPIREGKNKFPSTTKNIYVNQNRLASRSEKIFPLDLPLQINQLVDENSGIKLSKSTESSTNSRIAEDSTDSISTTNRIEESKNNQSLQTTESISSRIILGSRSSIDSQPNELITTQRIAENQTEQSSTAPTTSQATENNSTASLRQSSTSTQKTVGNETTEQLLSTSETTTSREYTSTDSLEQNSTENSKEMLTSSEETTTISVENADKNETLTESVISKNETVTDTTETEIANTTENTTPSS